MDFGEDVQFPLKKKNPSPRNDLCPYLQVVDDLFPLENPPPSPSVVTCVYPTQVCMETAHASSPPFLRPQVAKAGWFGTGIWTVAEEACLLLVQVLSV